MTDLGRAIERHAPRLAGRVLDYGCGTRPYEPLFAHATYIGADFPDNPDAPEIDIPLDPEGRLPQDADDFDAVISTQVLEHASDTGLYLSECRRVLHRRRGSLLLTTHGIWPYHADPRDLWRWTHEGLVSTVEGHGFETEKIEPITSGLRSLLQLTMATMQARGEGAWPFHLDWFFLRPLEGRRWLFWLLNAAVDMIARPNGMVDSFYDLPLCYLYLGPAT